jgi:hypothetical protein
MYDNTNKGSFWIATDRQTGLPKMNKKGEQYWSGKINIEGKDYNAVMFFNKDKKNPKQPDYSVMIMEDKQYAPQPATPAPSQEINTSEIPF